MALFLPQRWRIQPTTQVNVDWNHPLAEQLVISAPLWRDRSVFVTGSPQQANFSGAIPRLRADTYAHGFYSTFGTATSDNVNFASPHGSGVITWSIWYQRNGAGGTSLGRLFDKGDDSGVSGYRVYGTTSTIVLNVDHSTTTHESRISSAFNTNWNHLVIQYNTDTPGTGAVMYLNGVSQSVTLATAGVGTQLTNTNPIYIGNRKASTNRGWDGHLRDFLQYSRALTATEIAELYRNPWQIYRKRNARIYSFPSGGAVDTTISVPKGSLTLSAKTPTVSVTNNVTVSIPKGSIVLTGYSPTVVASDLKTVSVPKASLVLNGYAPTVSVTSGTSATVIVPKGTLTLTGYAPTVGVPQTIQVPKGGLILTGYSPTVKTDVVVLVPKGTLTITGKIPTVNVTNNKLIEVPKEALSLQGYAPTVLGTIVQVATKGGISEPDKKLRDHLRRLAIQQARLEDDEEALAILLATLMRDVS